MENSCCRSVAQRTLRQKVDMKWSETRVGGEEETVEGRRDVENGPAVADRETRNHRRFSPSFMP
jgi:hypothetical protein